MATQQSDRSSVGKELVPAATSAQWRRSTQAAMAGLTGNTHFRIIKKKIKAALCAVIMKTHFLWMHVLRSNSLASNKCQFPLQLFPRLGTPLSHVDSLMSNKGCTHAAAFLSMGPLIRSPSSIKTACFHETRRNIASLRLRASPLPSSLAETG